MSELLLFPPLSPFLYIGLRVLYKTRVVVNHGERRQTLGFLACELRLR